MALHNKNINQNEELFAAFTWQVLGTDNVEQKIYSDADMVKYLLAEIGIWNWQHELDKPCLSETIC